MNGRKTRVNPRVIVVGDFVAVVNTLVDGTKLAWLGEVVWVHDDLIGVRGLYGNGTPIPRGQVTRVA